MERMTRMKTTFVERLIELNGDQEGQQMYIDTFNSYYQSERRGRNLGRLVSITIDVNEDNVGDVLLNFEGGVINWFYQKNDWVVKYSELGRVSPPEEEKSRFRFLLPNGGPDYVLARARYENKTPVREEEEGTVLSVKRTTISEEENPNKDQELGGFRRKKRKRTRRKRCSKKSSKKNKKTFRR